MKSGKFTARSLVEKYSARIEEIDKAGPAVNAIIEMNPDAPTIAEALDQERKAKGPRGPLHGIPVLIKDNIDYRRSHDDDCGIAGAGGSKPPKDSFVAQRLAGGRRGHSGQDESQRVGQHPLQPFDQRMERTRRADQESLCARPQSLRIEFGHRRRNLREPGSSGNRHGDGRLDCLPFVFEWTGRHQADGWAGQPRGDHSDFAFAGHGAARCAARCAMPRFC